jgi:multicomponent Na+:H+ antiporter subunit D
MIGVPPTAGFFGKWFILTSALGSGQWIAVAVMFASTVLTAGYFLPIVYAAFFGENADAHEHGEAPWPIVVALVATAAASIVLFLFPGAALDLARQMVER